jgi:hypothetical protein
VVDAESKQSKRHLAPMLPKTRNVVSPKKFDALFQEEARIATFASPEEETAYERRDSFLIYLIRREVQKCFGPGEEQQPYVGDDWWPNHTRYIDATPAHCTSAFLIALRGLLTEEYKNYRIQICVYGDTLDGKSYIGAMALHSDRVLIETKLNELLQQTESA